MKKPERDFVKWLMRVNMWIKVIQGVFALLIISSFGLIIYLIIESLSGKHTLADININVSFLSGKILIFILTIILVLIFGVGALLYAIFRSRLSTSRTKWMKKRIRDLEKEKDPNRSSVNFNGEKEQEDKE